MATKTATAPTEPKIVSLALGNLNYVLDARKRCDHSQCNAQAYIRATLASTGGELYFCGGR